MAPKRHGAAGACADKAGTIESSSGSASVTPMPCNTARRLIAFFVMIVDISTSLAGGLAAAAGLMRI
jgi:hypothetical protein